MSEKKVTSFSSLQYKCAQEGCTESGGKPKAWIEIELESETEIVTVIATADNQMWEVDFPTETTLYYSVTNSYDGGNIQDFQELSSASDVEMKGVDFTFKFDGPVSVKYLLFLKETGEFTHLMLCHVQIF